jgi:hypothetical protein
VADISHWPERDPGAAAPLFYGGVALKPAGLQAMPREPPFGTEIPPLAIERRMTPVWRICAGE